MSIADLFSPSSFSSGDPTGAGNFDAGGSAGGSDFGAIAGAGLGGLGSIFQGIGGNIAAQGQASADRAIARGDLAAEAGYRAESQAYSEAAGFSRGNVQLAAESTLIQQYQQQRALAQSLGKTTAELGAAGLSSGGSGLDILRSSMAQGALARGLIGVQGSVEENAYAAQAVSEVGLSKQAEAAATTAQTAADAARAQASAAGGAGALGILGGIVGAASKIIPFL